MCNDSCRTENASNSDYHVSSDTNYGCGNNCYTGCNTYCTGCSGNCAGISNSATITGDASPQTITAEHIKINWESTTKAVYTGAKTGDYRVTDENVDGGPVAAPSEENPNGTIAARTYNNKHGATVYTSINSHKS